MEHPLPVTQAFTGVHHSPVTTLAELRRLDGRRRGVIKKYSVRARYNQDVRWRVKSKLRLAKMWKSYSMVKPGKWQLFSRKTVISLLFILYEIIFCQKEFSRWKFVVAVWKTFIPCLLSHLCSNLFFLDRHKLVHLSASQMQILLQFSALTIYWRSSCLYVASSGGYLALGWGLFPSLPFPIYHLFSIKSWIPTVCLYRMPAFIVYSIHFQTHIFTLSCPSCLGVDPLNI